MKKRIPILVLAMCVSSAAFADDAGEVNGTKCKPAKDLIKVISKMSSMKESRTDTVAAFPKMQISAAEGFDLPERLFVRSGSKETDLLVDAEGRVSSLDIFAGLDKNTDFCVQDKALIGLAEGEKSMSMSMDFDVSYKNKSGIHELAELRDGLDDGRAHIKKLVPGPVRFMVPKFDHVLIEYLGEDGETIDKEPMIFAYKGDQKIEGLEMDRLENMHFVKIDQLEELGADQLRIDGGAYKMDPSPNAEKIKDFMKDE